MPTASSRRSLAPRATRPSAAEVGAVALRADAERHDGGLVARRRPAHEEGGALVLAANPNLRVLPFAETNDEGHQLARHHLLEVVEALAAEAIGVELLVALGVATGHLKPLALDLHGAVAWL